MSGVDVMAAAAEVEGFCRTEGLRFCFIGGIAVQRWGMPRFTQDVDATVLVEIGDEGTIIDTVLAGFASRRPDARRFALENRILLARSSAGIPLDLALGSMDFEVRAVARATLWEVSGTAALTTVSAEDLIVHKVFAGRDRDWADVDGILMRQHGKLNLAQIRSELGPLLEMKEDSSGLEQLERHVVAADAQVAGE